MSATIDDRLLERWEVSRRHQEEARRFLARQRFTDPRGERLALEEIVGTISDLERTLRERANRRRPHQGGQDRVRSDAGLRPVGPVAPPRTPA